jgi:O-antigen ligase
MSRIKYIQQPWILFVTEYSKIVLTKIIFQIDKNGGNVIAFALFGLLFVPKISTLIPTLLLIIGIFLVFISKDYRSRWIKILSNPLVKWISWSFLFWFVSSVLIAIYHIKNGTFVFPSNALRIAASTTLFCINFSTKSDEKFVIGLIFAAAIAAMSSIFGLIDGEVRIQGATNNPIHFGNMTAVVMAFCITLIALPTKITKRYKLLLLIGAVLAAWASFTSQTRSSALIILCVIPAFLINPKKLSNKNIILLTISICFLFATLLLTSVKIRDLLRISEPFQELNSSNPINYEKISGYRYEMWRAGWIIFKNHPIAGIGPGQFKENLESLAASGIVEPTAIFNQPHNDIIHAASSGGLIKLSSYLCVIIVPFLFFYSIYSKSSICSRSKTWSYLGMQTVGAYFLFGFTNSGFDLQIYSTTYSVLIVLLAKFSLFDFPTDV